MRSRVSALAVCSLALLGAGCLPIGYGASASGFGGAAVAKTTRPEIGGEASLHLFPQGSRGVAVTGDFATLSSALGTAIRGGLGAGYAYVPPPFEAHWGYEVTARFGLGDVPGDPQLTLRPGARAALLYRPWQSDTVWHQDREPSGVLWFVGPFVSIDSAIPTSAASTPWVDAVAGLAVYALHYDIGAP